MIFEVDPVQISRLESTDLVRLLRRLLLAECQEAGLPLRASSVSLRITVADGGEDGRVEWEGGKDATEFLPARFCIFQSKAQNLTERIVSSEVLKRVKKRAESKTKLSRLKKGTVRSRKAASPKIALNAAISDALKRRGAYILFCSHDFTGQKKDKLCKAVESAVRAAGRNPNRLAEIAVYDADLIAKWASTHVGVALWLTSLERKRSTAGFQSLEQWQRARDIAGVEWVASDDPRFIPIGVGRSDDDAATRLQWDFGKATGAALSHLSQDRRILRIVGPSGFGKSRFAYQMLSQKLDVVDEIIGSSVIYADYSIVGDECVKLALEIAEAGSPSILVVDECDDSIHRKLDEIVNRQGSRLRLITIDVTTRLKTSENTLVIGLRSASSSLINGIAKKIAPELSGESAQFIGKLANGFPRMAVLAAKSRDRRDVLFSMEQAVDRIVWGGKSKNEDAQRALESLSLFDWLGVSGNMSDQAAFVAKELVGTTESLFVEHVKSFKARGIIAHRGNFVQLQPIPLAARLADRRLAVIPDGKLLNFFQHAPHQLRLSLLKRLRWLDTSEWAQAFAHELLQPAHLGNLSALSSETGSQYVDALVHVNPNSTMSALVRVLGVLSIEELRQLEGGRRHVVWSLEKLAFRSDTFLAAATLLRRLGAAEVENGIDNNASGHFKQLFKLYLSATEVGPERRLEILDSGLVSMDQAERHLSLEALGGMLQTAHFTRSGGAEEIGSAERLIDWQPKTHGEIWNFFRAAISRLLPLALSSEPEAGRAKELLAANVRGLINRMPFSDVKAMLEEVSRQQGTWFDAIKELNEWLFYNGGKAPPKLTKLVRSLFDNLMPTDPIDLVELYVGGWQADFHDPDINYEMAQKKRQEYDYSAKQAVALADIIVKKPAMLNEAVDRFATSNAKSIFLFARRLSELTSKRYQLFIKAMRLAESKVDPINRQFFSGLIAGADKVNPDEARKCIRAALKSPKLKGDAVSLIGANKLTTSDLRLVISLLKGGDIKLRECAALSNGRGLDHFSPAEIIPFLDELSSHGTVGLWSALDVLSMYLYGREIGSKQLFSRIKGILLSPALMHSFNSHVMDAHHLEVVTEKLQKQGQLDGKFAGRFARQVLNICRSENTEVYYEFDDVVRKILRLLLITHPREVWREVTDIITSKSALTRNFANQLFEFDDDDDYFAPGLLFDMPEGIYLSWVRECPGKRAAIVVEWLPIVSRPAEGELVWHPALERFMLEFNAERGVLDALAQRLRPHSFWGSLKPYLTMAQKLLGLWVSHSNRILRLWAIDQLSKTGQALEAAAKQDGEDDPTLFD